MRVEIDSTDDVEKGRVVQQAASCIYGAGSSLRNFPGLLKQIIWAKAWERRVSKGTVIELPSLRELITEKPIKGWGEDPKKVEAVIRDDPEALAMFRAAMLGTLSGHGGDRNSKQARQVQADGVNLTVATGAGNSNAYWLARILRDCPEEFDAIKRGDKRIIDVRTERGCITKSKRITLTGDSMVDRQRLLDVFGEDYLQQLTLDA